MAITSVRLTQMLGGAIGTAVPGAVLARSYAAHLPDALKDAQGGEPSATRIREALAYFFLAGALAFSERTPAADPAPAA